MDIREVYRKVKELDECGPMEGPMGGQMSNPGSPVSMNISLNASGMDNVEDLMHLLKNAGVTPSSKMAMAISPGPDGDEMMGPEPCPICGGMHEDTMTCEDWDNSPDEEYKDDDFMKNDLAGGINRKKKQYPASNRGDNAMAVKEQLMRNWKKFKPNN